MTDEPGIAPSGTAPPTAADEPFEMRPDEIVRLARGAADADPDALVVDVDGFEGPLDLLLTLAKTQKVDLARISVLALAEQYLAYVERARALRLELAADYLVMASWLAYLKSRLLLPPAEDEPLTGDELAADLAFRLQRLAVMREKAAALFARPRLGRDVFARGAPEKTVVTREITWQASLFDLLTAYAERRQRGMVTEVRFAKRTVWSLVDARKILERLVGRWADWVPLEMILSGIAAAPEERRTVRASGFGAALEMAKEGRVTIRQASPFSPIYVRAAAPAARPTAGAPGDGEATGERPRPGE